jgi:hypothetical protein
MKITLNNANYCERETFATRRRDSVVAFEYIS